MAKEFNVGDRVFIPAKITAVIGGGHYKAEFFVSKDEVKTESFNANVGTLFTAKQVSDKYIDGPTYDDLKTERDTLKMMLEERDRLLASANADIATLKASLKREIDLKHETDRANFRTRKVNAILIDKIDELEAELAEEKEKHNG
jgi:hypothetical protein